MSPEDIAQMRADAGFSPMPPPQGGASGGVDILSELHKAAGIQGAAPAQTPTAPELPLADRIIQGANRAVSWLPGQKLGEAIGGSVAAINEMVHGNWEGAKQIEQSQPAPLAVGADAINAALTPATLAIPGATTLKGAMGTGFGLGVGQSVLSDVEKQGKLSDISATKALAEGGVSSLLFGLGHGIGKLIDYMTSEGADKLMKSAINESPKEIAKEINGQAPVLSQQLLENGVPPGSENSMLSHAYAALNTTEKAIQDEALKYKNIGNEGLSKTLTTQLVDTLKNGGWSKSADTIATLPTNLPPEQLATKIRIILGDTAKNPEVKKALNTVLSNVQQVAQSRQANSIETKAVADALSSTIKTAKNVPGNEHAVRELNRIQASILQRGDRMSIPDALQLKRDIYGAIGSRGFNVDAKLSANTEGLRTVASALNDELGKINPTIKALTDQQQMWIRLADGLENKVAKSGKDIVGLKDAVLAAGGDFRGVGSVVGRRLLETTRLKSTLARGLNAADKVSIPAIGSLARFGTVKEVNAIGSPTDIQPQ